MKRARLSRRAMKALPPGPVFRDVHPDREPVAFYGPDGKPSLVLDLEARLMAQMRVLARRKKQPLHSVLVGAFIAHVDKLERGFR